MFWGEAAEPWGPFICCHVLARRVRNWDVLHRGGGTHPSRPGAPLRWRGAGRVTGYFPVIGLFAFLCNRVVDTGIAYGDTAVGGVRLLSEPPPSPAAGRPRSAAVGCSRRRARVSPTVPSTGSEQRARVTRGGPQVHPSSLPPPCQHRGGTAVRAGSSGHGTSRASDRLSAAVSAAA